MKIFVRISNTWRNLHRRRRLTLQNSTDNQVEWDIHISLINAILAFLSLVVFITILILSLAKFTPILDFLPSYRSDISKSNNIMIENILRVDSMERVINDMMRYNDNIALIMEGKTPVVRSSQVEDSVALDRTIALPNSVDSALRRQMEGDGIYNLQRAAINMSTMMLTPPIEGEIIQRFDIGSDTRAIKIEASGGESRVVSIGGGMVILSLWSPETNYMVEVQHPKGVISIYKNLSQAIVKSGEMVKSGEVIGYSQADVEFEFELWEDGKPVNPENYIIF